MAASCTGGSPPPVAPREPERIAIIAPRADRKGRSSWRLDEHGDRRFDLLIEAADLARARHQSGDLAGRQMARVRIEPRAHARFDELVDRAARAGCDARRAYDRPRSTAIPLDARWPRDRVRVDARWRRLRSLSTRDRCSGHARRRARATDVRAQVTRSHRAVARDGTIIYAEVTPSDAAGREPPRGPRGRRHDHARHRRAR